ncbi:MULTISPECIES: hypothetical protein [unclassified Geodermatophilus]
MAPRTTDGSGLVELARREHGAVEVTLLWDRGTGAAVVVVWNWDTGTCLRLEVEPGRAGYAFAHPYAVAAEQEVSSGDVLQAA